MAVCNIRCAPSRNNSSKSERPFTSTCFSRLITFFCSIGILWVVPPSCDGGRFLFSPSGCLFHNPRRPQLLKISPACLEKPLSAGRKEAKRKVKQDSWPVAHGPLDPPHES